MAPFHGGSILRGTQALALLLNPWENKVRVRGERSLLSVSVLSGLRCLISASSAISSLQNARP